jgi:hypothetical protein
MTAAAASAAAPPSAAATGVGAMPFRAPDDVAMPLGATGAPWLLLALLLAIGVWAAFKRRVRLWKRQPGLLEVDERCSLTNATQLVVARYAGRRLLLSVGPAGTQLLRDDAEEASS